MERLLRAPHDHKWLSAGSPRIDKRCASAEETFMAYQRGSLLKLHREAGDIWVLRYHENKDGRRVQNDLSV